MNPEKQLFIMMLGVPGAGKSYFARNLAERQDMQRITADEVRTRLFGSINAGRTKENHIKTYEVVDREMEEALRRGGSVIRDNQNNGREDRIRATGIANEVGGLAVVVWVQTPREIAVQRAMERPATKDQLKLDEKTANEFVDRSLEAIEPPQSDEPFVEIDGQLEFEDQYQAFLKFIEEQ